MPPRWALLPLLPLRLCRPRPCRPPARALAAAAAQRSGPSNYYELLGVDPGASAEEVKRAFFTKSKELHPDRDPGNPTLHSRFVELNEAYHVLSHEQSRLSYDRQLRSAGSSASPGTTAHPKPPQHTHSSWAPPNAQYWAQFHHARPQGPESRRATAQKQPAGAGVLPPAHAGGHGPALHRLQVVELQGRLHPLCRKLEQVHRNFMDEKDRIITAIYNDTRARARARGARLRQDRQQRPPLPSGPPPAPAPAPAPGIVPRGTRS